MGQNGPAMTGVVEKLSRPDESGLRLSTGERIRILRGRARITRPQLAEWAHVHVKSLARYETDQIMPPGDKLGMIALMLETTTDYLLGLTEDPVVPDPDQPTRVWLNPAMAVA